MDRDDKNEENDKALKLIDELLSKNKLEMPSSNFTHKVMANLHSMPVATSLSPKNGILLLGGTMVAVMILTVLVNGGMFDSVNQTINLPQLKQSVPVSGTLVVKGLIVLNIVLAFVLFDRTVLRPFFSRRSSSL